MALVGMLIDYENCTGCRACEMACHQEYGHEIGKTGILVNEIGPLKINKMRWQIDYSPAPTDKCIQCAGRVAKGKRPTCVQHCQSQVIEIGPYEELAAKVKTPKQVLYSI